MLTKPHRLASSRRFSDAVRQGRRAAAGGLVLHLAAPESVPVEDRPAQVGFVVSKAVGPAVIRNLVKRRLRHIARDRVETLPGGSALVVRALPTAGRASYRLLRSDFERALARLADPARHGSGAAAR